MYLAQTNSMAIAVGMILFTCPLVPDPLEGRGCSLPLKGSVEMQYVM